MRIASGAMLAAELLLIVVCVSLGCQRSGPTALPGTTVAPRVASDFPLSSVGASPLQNTSSQATFVGSQACVECHPGQAETYQRTPHSLAMGDIELDAEPVDGEFDHPPTRRAYRTYRQAGQLWHRESIQTDGQQLVLGEYPLRYVIGSGNHSRSYLVEIDGFLVESPLTWYTSRQEWSLSPGYDKAQFGFSRPASLQCLSCHAGRVESTEGSLHRLKLHEYAIGCERCHGPGSLHVARWNSDGEASDNDDADFTIAHPGRLSRELQEAICDQCHLRSATAVSVRGRQPSDFRPGLRLQDFQVHYGLRTPTQEMKVAGHAEQMRLSLCYQNSETLTCTTCHDPHDRPAHEMGQAHFRQLCVRCHGGELSCGLPELERLKQSPADNCVGCHMPKVPIDVPHFAFTHHRIGIHESPEAEDYLQSAELGGTIGTLEPLHDLSHLSQIDRDRCLGLGYLDMASAARLRGDSAAFRNYRERAQQSLEGVYNQGLRDAELEVALAGLFSDKDRERAVQLAESALRRDSQLTPDARVNAHLILGSAFFQSKENRRAIEYLERLVRLRREAEDWMMLGVCRHREGDADGALLALKQAAEISPARADVHQFLAEFYQLSGDTVLQRQHRQKFLMFSQRPRP